MPPFFRIAPFAFGTFAFAACWLAAVAQAQQPPTQFQPITRPPLTPDLLTVPHAAPDAGTNTFTMDKRQGAAQPLRVPKGFDLGNYQFNFDARRTKDVVVPGVTTDSGEKSNLSTVTGPKQESAVPNYFGFKLSVPTH